MKRIKKILFAVITFILVLVIAFNLYNVFCIKILKKDISTINGYAVLEVVSGSMEPTIHVGDLIVINTKEDFFEENDIVTFYDVEGSFVTHRILTINDDEMITKGDNNNSEDEPIAVDNIVGKYAFKVGGLGKLLSALKNPIVMGLILVIGVLACVFISTDKDGKPLLDEEEKEFQEYLKNKDKMENENKKKETVVKKTTTAKKEKDSSSKAAEEKTTKKKNANSKKDEKEKNVVKKATGNKKTTSSKKTTAKKGKGGSSKTTTKKKEK